MQILSDINYIVPNEYSISTGYLQPKLYNTIPMTNCLKSLRELQVQSPPVQLFGAVLPQLEDPEE